MVAIIFTFIYLLHLLDFLNIVTFNRTGACEAIGFSKCKPTRYNLSNTFYLGLVSYFIEFVSDFVISLFSFSVAAIVYEQYYRLQCHSGYLLINRLLGVVSDASEFISIPGCGVFGANLCDCMCKIVRR